jgi:hypothetical protein
VPFHKVSQKRGILVFFEHRPPVSEDTGDPNAFSTIQEVSDIDPIELSAWRDSTPSDYTLTNLGGEKSRTGAENAKVDTKAMETLRKST